MVEPIEDTAAGSTTVAGAPSDNSSTMIIGGNN